MQTRLEGHDAIRHATATGRTLSKYADPTEDAREGVGVDEAEEIAAEDPGLLYLDIVAAETLELYEDNGGGLWLAAPEEGVATEMASDGDFLTDARLYRDEWYPEDMAFEDSLRGLDGLRPLLTDPQTTHVATYRPATDDLRIHVPPHEMGHAAREYLAASLEAKEEA